MTGRVFPEADPNKAGVSVGTTHPWTAGQIEAIADITRALAEVSPDIHATLEAVASASVRHLGLGCDVRLLAADRAALLPGAFEHRDPATRDRLRPQFAGPWSLDPHLYARLAAGEVILILPEADPMQSDELASLRTAFRSMGLKAVALVPMMKAGDLVGIIGVIRDEVAPLDDEARGFYRDIADRAALVIENARLFEAERVARAGLESAVEERTRELKSVIGELGAFTDRVSHDLRGPLRSFATVAAALEEDMADELGPTGVKIVHTMQTEAERMHDLVQGLLLLSKATTADLRREHVDVSDLARNVAEGLAKEDPTRQATWSIAPGLAADADPTLLRVVLTNLLGNAWKYSAKRPDARIELGCERVGGEDVFFVKDNGVGFSRGSAARLFTPFTRLHDPKQFEGTGIGLAMVRRVAERHGGRVEAEGAVDEGATFRFTLAPRPKPPPA